MYVNKDKYVAMQTKKGSIFLQVIYMLQHTAMHSAVSFLYI